MAAMQHHVQTATPFGSRLAGLRHVEVAGVQQSVGRSQPSPGCELHLSKATICPDGRGGGRLQRAVDRLQQIFGLVVAAIVDERLGIGIAGIAEILCHPGMPRTRTWQVPVAEISPVRRARRARD